MGFEPMMRVLQTLALPLGHVAIKFGLAVMARNEPYHASRLFLRERAMGFEPTTFSLARRRTTTVLRPHFGRSTECRINN